MRDLHSGLLTLACSGFGLLLGACFEAGTADECIDGVEGCACYANQTCNDGLVCEGELCVEQGGETVGDGDGDISGDGDGDGDGDEDGEATTLGDGDTDTGDGDGDPPEGDLDMDGIMDAEDNCPDRANPQQLDFDGDGAGNVCDHLVFFTVSGALDTTFWFGEGGLFACEADVTLEVTGGIVTVLLDDDAANALVRIVQLELADTGPDPCDLNFFGEMAVELLDGELRSEELDAIPFVYDQAMHDAGTIASSVDVPHTIGLEATPVLEDNMLPPEVIAFEGALPVFAVQIDEAGEVGALAWEDPNAEVLSGQMDADLNLFSQIVPIGLRGLEGNLQLLP